MLQPKSAKGADGKYPRGYMAGLKEKLGGEAAGLLYAHMVPDSANPNPDPNPNPDRNHNPIPNPDPNPNPN